MVAGHATGSTTGHGSARDQHADYAAGLCVCPHAFGQRLVGVDFLADDEILSKGAEGAGAGKLQPRSPYLGHGLHELAAQTLRHVFQHPREREHVQGNLSGGVLSRDFPRLIFRSTFFQSALAG